MDEVRLTPEQYNKMQQESAIMKEMMPYFFYALIPLIITITIAVICAPNMTLP